LRWGNRGVKKKKHAEADGGRKRIEKTTKRFDPGEKKRKKNPHLRGGEGGRGNKKKSMGNTG